MTYYQCTLAKGNSILITYLPKKFDILHKYLKLHNEDGWQVIRIGSETNDPPDWRKAIRSHRQRTGDSMPRTAVDKK